MNRSLAGLCLLVLFSGTASPVLGQPSEIVKAVDLVSALRDSPGADWVTLRTGDLLLLDNWRLLHARGPAGAQDREIIRGLAT